MVRSGARGKKRMASPARGDTRSTRECGPQYRSSPRASSAANSASPPAATSLDRCGKGADDPPTVSTVCSTLGKTVSPPSKPSRASCVGSAIASGKRAASLHRRRRDATSGDEASASELRVSEDEVRCRWPTASCGVPPSSLALPSFALPFPSPPPLFIALGSPDSAGVASAVAAPSCDRCIRSRPSAMSPAASSRLIRPRSRYTRGLCDSKTAAAPGPVDALSLPSSPAVGEAARRGESRNGALNVAQASGRDQKRQCRRPHRSAPHGLTRRVAQQPQDEAAHWALGTHPPPPPQLRGHEPLLPAVLQKVGLGSASGGALRLRHERDGRRSGGVRGRPAQELGDGASQARRHLAVDGVEAVARQDDIGTPHARAQRLRPVESVARHRGATKDAAVLPDDLRERRKHGSRIGAQHTPRAQHGGREPAHAGAGAQVDNPARGLQLPPPLPPLQDRDQRRCRRPELAGEELFREERRQPAVGDA
eukprot:scaffold1658_cov115-Isochrysis_galbana.AAC.17